MKRLLLPLILLLVCAKLHAQRLDWDSTYRPGNYPQRVANFRSYANDSSDIIFLGNSITDYAEWNELLNESRARNRGISGDISFGVLERLDEVIEGQPAKLFILIGINDISRNIPDSVILQNQRLMLERVKAGSPHTRIYFNTLLPVNNSFPTRNHFNKDEHIAAVNAGLKKMAKEERITLIDIHPAFADTDGRLKKELTYDGLHLNAEGYKLWASILKPYVNE